MLLIAVLNRGRLLLSSLLFEFLICVFRNLLKNRTDGFRWSMTRGSARLREFFSAVALQMSGWQKLEVRMCMQPSPWACALSAWHIAQVLGGMNEMGSRNVGDVVSGLNIPVRVCSILVRTCTMNVIMHCLSRHALHTACRGKPYRFSASVPVAGGSLL